MSFKTLFKAFCIAILQFVIIFFIYWGNSKLLHIPFTEVNYVCTCIFVLTVDYFYDKFEQKQNTNKNRW